MKKKWIIIMFITAVLFCGCSSPTPKEDSSMQSSGSAENLPVGPVINPTFEEKVELTAGLLNNVQDSYQIMLNLSSKEGAPKKGVKAAQKVQKKYSSRLEELAEINLSEFSVDELNALSIELSNILTSIRQARDALN